jgi:DNA-binding Lrp family transcriptional regulator
MVFIPLLPFCADMDSFDRQILTVLQDGKPRDFQQLLRKAGFSHNTLNLRLVGLEREGFVLKAKKPRVKPGRPSFAYFLRPDIKHRVALTLTDPYTVIVSLTFQKLKHLCRFEKGEYCKAIRRTCEAQNCPQTIKG